MRDEIDQHDRDMEASFGGWLVESIAKVYECEPKTEMIEKLVYKHTDCGAWIKFDENGIKIGTIVEGSDAEYSERLKVDDLIEDFDEEQAVEVLHDRFYEALQRCEDFAEEHFGQDDEETEPTEFQKHMASEAASDGIILVKLTAKAMNCEPTIAAINEAANDNDEFPFKQTVTFDELGILLGVDVQGSKSTYRVPIDGLEWLDIDNGEAECELQARLIDGWLALEEFASKTYDPGPEREPGCTHQGNCDC